MFNNKIICTGNIIVAAVFCNVHAFLYWQLTFTRCQDIQVEQLSLSLSWHTGNKNVIFVHVFFHCAYRRSVSNPSVFCIVVKHLIEAVFFIVNILEKVICKFRVVHISHNNIKIGIFCVVKIVYISAFYKFKFLSEIRHIYCL